MEASDSSPALPATEEAFSFAGLDEIQTRLRHAVEDRDYCRALSLIEEQRTLFEHAGKTEPETQGRARAAHELCVWALTLIQFRREQLSRNIEELSAQKRVISCYAA